MDAIDNLGIIIDGKNKRIIIGGNHSVLTIGPMSTNECQNIDGITNGNDQTDRFVNTILELETLIHQSEIEIGSDAPIAHQPSITFPTTQPNASLPDSALAQNNHFPFAEFPYLERSIGNSTESGRSTAVKTLELPTPITLHSGLIVTAIDTQGIIKGLFFDTSKLNLETLIDRNDVGLQQRPSEMINSIVVNSQTCTIEHEFTNEELQFPELEPGIRTRLIQILKQFQTAFARKDCELGETSIIKHEIDTQGHHPIRMRPYRPPFKQKQEIDRQI